MSSIALLNVLFVFIGITFGERPGRGQESASQVKNFQRLQERPSKFAPHPNLDFGNGLNLPIVRGRDFVKGNINAVPKAEAKFAGELHFQYGKESPPTGDTSSSSVEEDSASSERDEDVCGGTTSITLSPSPQQEGKDECANGFEGSKMYFCNSTGSGFYNVDFQFTDPTPANAVVNLAIFDFYGAFDCFDGNHTLETVSGIVFLQDQHFNFNFPLKYGNCTNPYCTETPVFYFVLLYLILFYLIYLFEF